MTTTHIDLLRHGACEGGEIYRGSTDVALAQEGWVQMQASLGQGAAWDAVISSPLQRCQAFAQFRAGEIGVPLQIEPRLRELHFGEWEGRLVKEVWEEDPDTVGAYYRDPENVTPPGGESAVAVQARAMEAWRDIVEQQSGKRVLLVSHGGVIRLLLCALLDMPLTSIAQFSIPYASLSRLRVDRSSHGDFTSLLFLNAPLP